MDSIAGLAAALALSLAGGATPPAAAPEALRAAAREGRQDEVRSLLEGGASVDARGPRDWTALHEAVVAGQAGASEALLERGADPGARGQFDLTPLHWAALTGRADLIRLLAKRGAKLEARDLWGRTPMHLAAGDKAVRALAELGADVNAQDGRGITPLHVARNEDVANALLELKSDLRLRTRAGLTALDLQVADAPLDKGLQVVTGRVAGRLRGEKARMEVELRNLTAKPLAAIELSFQSAVCTATSVSPRFDLSPGELVILPVDLVRSPQAKEGDQPLTATLKLGGAEIARLDLVVDATRGETPEDRGMIHLGSGSVRRAPGAWANVAFVLGPVVLLGLWFGVRWWRARASGRPPPSSRA